ncbi:thioredoxin family protein [Bacillus salitolerans]|uniref:Thioredoxin family protein n=1 Tax=Bacillus salitolerans TaxID=1437434 RepID=A0ABW4LRK6_9BACI
MEVWGKEQIINQLQELNKLAIFFYTPICGTCKVAERMLVVVQELLPDLPLKKVDLNYIPDVAEKWQIQSVPCLLLFQHGEVRKRIFAFQSVEYLYKELKN